MLANPLHPPPLLEIGLFPRTLGASVLVTSTGNSPHSSCLISGAPTNGGSTNGSSSSRTDEATAAVDVATSGPQPQMTAAELRALIDGQLRPQLEKSVRQKRFEDELRLQQIMMTAEAAAEGGSLS